MSLHDIVCQLEDRRIYIRNERGQTPYRVPRVR